MAVSPTDLLSRFFLERGHDLRQAEQPLSLGRKENGLKSKKALIVDAQNPVWDLRQEDHKFKARLGCILGR